MQRPICGWTWGLVVGLSLFGTLTETFARDIYVNNLSGDDRWNGRTAMPAERRTGPVQSIGAALRLARPYDRIVVANTGRAYRESISLVGLVNSGNALAPFVIEGNGAVLDGSIPVRVDAWEHYTEDVFRYYPPRLAHPMLYLDDVPLERVVADEAQAKPPQLKPLQWCQHRRWVYFSIEPQKTLQDYNLTQPGGECGITIYKTNHVVITDLVVQGFRIDGVSAHDVTNTLLLGLTCRGNGRSGLASVGASQLTVEACLLGHNGQGPESTKSAQFIAADRSSTILENCRLLSEVAPEMLKLSPHVKVESRIAEAEPEEVKPEAEAKTEEVQ